MSLDKKITAHARNVNADGIINSSIFDIVKTVHRRGFYACSESVRATLLKLWLALKCFSSFTIGVLASIYGREASFH